MIINKEPIKNYLVSFLYNKELRYYREKYFDDNNFLLDFEDLYPNPLYPKLRANYNGTVGNLKYTNILPFSRTLKTGYYLKLPIYAFTTNTSSSSPTININFYVKKDDFFNEFGCHYDENIVNTYLNKIGPSIGTNELELLRIKLLSLYRAMIRQIHPIIFTNGFKFSNGTNIQYREPLKKALQQDLTMAIVNERNFNNQLENITYNHVRITTSDTLPDYYILTVTTNNIINEEATKNNELGGSNKIVYYGYIVRFNDSVKTEPIGYLKVHYLQGHFKENVISKPDLSINKWLEQYNGVPTEFISFGSDNNIALNANNVSWDDNKYEDYKEKLQIFQDGKPIDATIKTDINNNFYYGKKNNNGQWEKIGNTDIKNYFEKLEVTPSGEIILTTANINFNNIKDILLMYEVLYFEMNLYNPDLFVSILENINSIIYIINNIVNVKFDVTVENFEAITLIIANYINLTLDVVAEFLNILNVKNNKIKLDYLLNLLNLKCANLFSEKTINSLLSINHKYNSVTKLIDNMISIKIILDYNLLMIQNYINNLINLNVDINIDNSIGNLYSDFISMISEIRNSDILLLYNNSHIWKYNNKIYLEDNILLDADGDGYADDMHTCLYNYAPPDGWGQGDPWPNEGSGEVPDGWEQGDPWPAIGIDFITNIVLLKREDADLIVGNQFESYLINNTLKIYNVNDREIRIIFTGNDLVNNKTTIIDDVSASIETQQYSEGLYILK